jgi:hypothetical protein
MTKQQLIQYLRVCADLADSPKDGIAHVAIGPLRLAVQLLEGAAEPPAPTMRDLCKCTDDPRTCPTASTPGWCTCGCHAENRP